MPSIPSYFNPFSNNHHATERFSSLSAGKKFITIVATALATPFAIVGGVHI